MGSERLNGEPAAEQAQGPRRTELSAHAHREIGVWLAATPPEQRDEQRFLAEVARTHGLAARRGDQGWDVQAAQRAFWRVAGQDWWRKLQPEALRAPDLGKGFPLLQAALQRQGQGQGPRPAPGRSISQVMGAQHVGAMEEDDRLPTAAETAEQESQLRPVSRWGGWGDTGDAAGAGSRQQDSEGPLSAEEWLQKQMTMDSARNWLMEPARREQHLRAKLDYLQQRPSHPEWAPFDPPPPPGRAAARDLPPGHNWFSWELQGRPDLSPLPPRRHDLEDLNEGEIRRAFPQSETGLHDTGRGSLAVDPQWYDDNIVRIPNRWGIQDARDKLDRNGRKIGVEYFTPKDFQCHRLVAPHLVAALDEWDAKGLLYLVKTIEGYNPRYVSGTTTPSHHSYAIAFDVNQVEYPRRITGPEYQELKRQKRLPDQDERLIAIMQKHGFFHGGDYDTVSDVMHFEYADKAVLLPEPVR